MNRDLKNKINKKRDSDERTDDWKLNVDADNQMSILYEYIH